MRLSRIPPWGWILIVGAIAFSVAVGLHEAFFDDDDESGVEFLQEEFHLDAHAVQAIEELEKRHLEQTAKLVAELREKSGKFSQLLADGQGSHTERARLLKEIQQLRAQGQMVLLRHIEEVGEAMPAEQARRYLKWMAHRFTEDAEIQDPSADEK